MSSKSPAKLDNAVLYNAVLTILHPTAETAACHDEMKDACGQSIVQAALALLVLAISGEDVLDSIKPNTDRMAGASQARPRRDPLPTGALPQRAAKQWKRSAMKKGQREGRCDKPQ
jgi:hypothetical protein